MRADRLRCLRARARSLVCSLLHQDANRAPSSFREGGGAIGANKVVGGAHSPTWSNINHQLDSFNCGGRLLNEFQRTMAAVASSLANKPSWARARSDDLLARICARRSTKAECAS